MLTRAALQASVCATALAVSLSGCSRLVPIHPELGSLALIRVGTTLQIRVPDCVSGERQIMIVTGGWSPDADAPTPPTYWEAERPWPETGPGGGHSIEMGATTPGMKVVHAYTEPSAGSVVDVTVGTGKVAYTSEFDLSQVGTDLNLGLYDDGAGRHEIVASDPAAVLNGEDACPEADG